MHEDPDILDLISRPLFDGDFLHPLSYEEYKRHGYDLRMAVPDGLEDFIAGYLDGSDTDMLEFRRQRWMPDAVADLAADIADFPTPDYVQDHIDWRSFIEACIRRAAIVSRFGYTRALALATSELTRAELTELAKNPDAVDSLPDEYFDAVYLTGSSHRG